MNKKIIVALSGSGRTFSNLLKHQKKHQSFEICGVITSNKNSLGAALAEKEGFEVYYEKFSMSSKASTELSNWIKAKKPSLIVLAGFLKIFPTNLGLEENLSIVNIHPSLLPKFSGKGMYGSRIHEAVLNAKEKETGASIHFVNHVYDGGPLISQVKVPVFEADTKESIAQRVFEAECVLYPKTIEKIMTKELPLKGSEKIYTIIN